LTARDEQSLVIRLEHSADHALSPVMKIQHGASQDGQGFQETMHIGRLGVLTQRIGESSQERREGDQPFQTCRLCRLPRLRGQQAGESTIATGPSHRRSSTETLLIALC
jgi:hypothetical protein